MVNIQRIFTLFVGAIFISTVFGSWSFKEGIEKLQNAKEIKKTLLRKVEC